MVTSKSKRRLQRARQQSQHARIAALVKADREAKRGSFDPKLRNTYSVMTDLEKLAHGG